MVAKASIKYAVGLILLTFIPGWAATAPPERPPENYKGPIAERPLLQQGDYWIYQRANLTKTKTTTLPANVNFPLWVGKTWSYDTEMTRLRQPTKTAYRHPARVDCRVTAIKPVTVAAGTFDAFECECQCTNWSSGYQPGCGEFTIWYAPEVKNIISRKTESTATSMDLVEYKTSVPKVGAEIPMRDTPRPTQTVGEIQATPHKGPRVRVAVPRLENKTGIQGQIDIGNGMTEQLVIALVKSGKFIVLERIGLDDVLRERDLAKTGKMKPETAPALAKLDGAEYLILGTVTSFAPNAIGGVASGSQGGMTGTSGTSTGAIGGNIGASGNHQEAHVALDLRIIDTRTANVVNTTIVEGRPSTAGAGIGISSDRVAFGVQGFYNTPIGQAVSASLEKAVDWIVANAFAGKSSPEVRGTASSKGLPRVAEVMPKDGAVNVPPSLKEIVIVFDKPMSSSWSLACSPFFFPDAPEGGRCSASGTLWRDSKTFVVPIPSGLKPGQNYSYTINWRLGRPSFNINTSFRGLGQSEPVPSQRFFFTTGQ